MRVKLDSSLAPRSRSFGASAGSVAMLALTLCSAFACGGSNNDTSHVGSGASSSTGATAGTLNLIMPTGDGGSGNGSSSSGGDGSATGPYMLPAGYTPSEFGGYKTGAPFTGTTSGGSGSGGDTGSSCGTQILAVVRDFKGINEPMGHPDFEHFSGSTASKGIVQQDLGSDQKPVYASNGAFMDPMNGQQTTTKANFDQWYRNTDGVNKPYIVYLYFQPNNNLLTFESLTFFPIDNVGWGNTCHEPDATCQQWPHNYGFTTEVHTQFAYKGGETFTFVGDDDVWVFINKKLAIDLGGLHQQLTDQISLDSKAKDLGITVGNTYDLDLFHAERHTDKSDFRVDTNLAFTNCGTTVPDVPVK